VLRHLDIMQSTMAQWQCVNLCNLYKDYSEILLIYRGCVFYRAAWPSVPKRLLRGA